MNVLLWYDNKQHIHTGQVMTSKNHHIKPLQNRQTDRSMGLICLAQQPIIIM